MNPQTMNELNQIKQIILNTVKTESIYLFGSHAYGAPTADSDFDLYVVIPDDLRLL
jgi:predicted nucleotidyltransferase